MVYLTHQPAMDHRDNLGLLRGAQRLIGRNIVPLRQTAATAGRRRMLSNKHRMAVHRRLLAVVLRFRRRQTLSDESGDETVTALAAETGHPLGLYNLL